MISETIYTHKNKKGRYVILFPCEMQIKQKWYKALIYKSLDTGKIYVRKEYSFNLRFEVI